MAARLLERDPRSHRSGSVYEHRLGSGVLRDTCPSVTDRRPMRTYRSRTRLPRSRWRRALLRCRPERRRRSGVRPVPLGRRRSAGWPGVPLETSAASDPTPVGAIDQSSCQVYRGIAGRASGRLGQRYSATDCVQSPVVLPRARPATPTRPAMVRHPGTSNPGSHPTDTSPRPLNPGLARAVHAGGPGHTGSVTTVAGRPSGSAAPRQSARAIVDPSRGHADEGGHVFDHPPGALPRSNLSPRARP